MKKSELKSQKAGDQKKDIKDYQQQSKNLIKLKIGK